MNKCEICGKEISNKGNLTQHVNKCKKIFSIKDEVIDLYINELFSIRELRNKFKIQSEDIKNILGELVRDGSESSKVAHVKYPEKFKHSDETKKKLSKIRLEFMKNNPEKTSWRLSNVSYPEKLFIDYVENNGLDKKYSIIREYSVHPFFVDFAFTNEMVAVEIDGSQHLLPERKMKDEIKDSLLVNSGWTVIRISEKEIKTNIENVFNEIISILTSKPKNNHHRFGLVVKPKKYQKKERNEFGFTELEIKSMINQRKVTRPSMDILLEQIKTLGYVKTGKIYGVSDNSIRKWVKSFNKGL